MKVETIITGVQCLLDHNLSAFPAGFQQRPLCVQPWRQWTHPRPADCRVASDGGRNNTRDYTICCHAVGLATSMMQDRLPRLRNYRQRTNRFPEKISCVFLTSGPESCSGTTTMRLNVEEPLIQQSSDAVLHQFLHKTNT